MTIFEEIKSFLGDDEKDDSNLIPPFPLLTKNAVESLRYRAEVILLSLLSFMIWFPLSFPFKGFMDHFTIFRLSKPIMVKLTMNLDLLFGDLFCFFWSPCLIASFWFLICLWVEVYCTVKGPLDHLIISTDFYRMLQRVWQKLLSENRELKIWEMKFSILKSEYILLSLSLSACGPLHQHSCKIRYMACRK